MSTSLPPRERKRRGERGIPCNDDSGEMTIQSSRNKQNTSTAIEGREGGLDVAETE